MPFTGCRFDKLLASPHSNGVSGPDATLASQAEFELRQSIELVRGRSTVQSCHTAAKVKLSARARTQLRLPVIQVMVDDVGAETHLVLAMRPPQVVGTGKAPVVAESRVPSF